MQRQALCVRISFGLSVVRGKRPRRREDSCDNRNGDRSDQRQPSWRRHQGGGKDDRGHSNGRQQRGRLFNVPALPRAPTPSRSRCRTSKPSSLTI